MVGAGRDTGVLHARLSLECLPLVLRSLRWHAGLFLWFGSRLSCKVWMMHGSMGAFGAGRDVPSLFFVVAGQRFNLNS